MLILINNSAAARIENAKGFETSSKVYLTGLKRVGAH